MDNNKYGSFREAFEARKKRDMIIKIVLAAVILCLLVVVIRFIKYSDFIQSRREKNAKVTSKELSKDENYYSVPLDKYIFDPSATTCQIGTYHHLESSDVNLAYNITYISIGSEKIDKSVAEIAVSIADSFTEDYKDFDAAAYGKQASLNVECYSYLAGDSVVSFVFYKNYDSPEYTEPVQQVETHSFLLKTEEEFTTEDIMKDDYLKLFSDKTIEYLENDVRFADTASDKDFKKNYKASEENFKLFAFTKASILLFFEPYKVAPSEYGIVTVEIDAADARPYMKYNVFKYVPVPMPTPEPVPDEVTEVVAEEPADVDPTDNIDPDKPMIAFTFDDGPREESTNKILDVLEQYGCHATFFIVGNRIKYGEETIKRAFALGCDVGNHSYSHAKLSDLSGEDIERQIEKTNTLLKKVIDTKAALVRTPYGESSSKVLKHVHYPVILWDVDTLDWKSRKKNKIVKKIMGNISDGDIVLMHDIYDSTADAVEKVVPMLLEKGYQIVSVSELLKYKGVDPEPNKTYFSLKNQ